MARGREYTRWPGLAHGSTPGAREENQLLSNQKDLMWKRSGVPKGKSGMGNEA